MRRSDSRPLRRLAPALLAACLIAAGSAPAQDEPAFRRALPWLLARLTGDAAPRAHAEQGNAAAMQMVASSALQFALESVDATPEVAAAREVLRQQLGTRRRGIETAAFGNWIDGFDALAAAESALRGQPSGRVLRRCASGFAERQNAEGGFGHGGGSMVDFYPSTLMITTELAIAALGLAKRAGTPIDEEVLASAIRLLETQQAPSGALPYGGGNYRKGYEAGRTAAAIFALAAAGRADSPAFAAAARYFRANQSEVPNGHASPALHVLMGALAAAILGADDWRAYDLAVLGRVRAAQAEDGSFADIVPGSPDSLDLLGGREVEDLYRACLYSAALLAKNTTIVASLREGLDATRPREDGVLAEADAQSPPLWSTAAPEGGPCHLAADRAWLLDHQGILHAFDRRNGAAAGALRIAPGRSFDLEAARLLHREPRLIAWLPDAGISGNGGRLAVIDPDGPTLLWQREVKGLAAAIDATADQVLWLGLDARLRRFAAATGEDLAGRESSGLTPNLALAVWPDGRVATARESRLEVRSSSLETLWEKRGRRLDGLTPPAYSALLAAGDLLHAARTDGTIQTIEMASGRERTPVRLGAAITALGASGGESGRVLALCGDGRLHALEDGQLRWTTDAGRGRDRLRPLQLHCREGGVWVHAPGRARLLRFDPSTGAESDSVPVEELRHWSPNGNQVLLTRAGRLELR